VNLPLHCIRHPMIDIIVLSKDNIDELRSTLLSCVSLSDCSAFRVTISVYDSSQCFSSVRSLVDRFKALTSGDMKIVLNHIYPPSGIYPAMNYALNLSQSDSLIFMNSGDAFYSSASLCELATAFYSEMSRNASLSCAFGRTMFEAYNSRMCWINPYVSFNCIKSWLKFYYPCHQSVIFKTSWAKAHPYDPSVGIAADSKVICAAIANSSYLYVPKCVSVFRLNGISSRSPKSLNQIFSVGQSAHAACIKFLLSPPFIPNMLPFFSRIKSFLVNSLIFIAGA